ncbi:MAG: hypothetical protein RLZZ15_2948 [Verrucomicrobiota bacterium]
MITPRRPRLPAFLLSLLAFAPAAPAAPIANAPVAGLNVTWNKTWVPATYWNNAVLGCEKWSNDTTAGLARDADGYPTAFTAGNVNRIPVFSGNDFYPSGDYVLKWDGAGELEVTSSAVITLQSSAVGRKVYTVPVGHVAGFFIRWMTSSASPNHVKNVRLFLPGGENSTQITSARFRADYAKAEIGVIRTMNWVGTNSDENPDLVWADRTRPTEALQYPLAWEHVVTAANELGKDLWLNVPHKVDDAYVTQLATLVRNNLAAGRRVWVELSNEVWNVDNSYPQTPWVEQNVTIPGNPTASPDQKYAYRSVQIFDLFDAVFAAGGANPRARVIRVLGTQTTVPSKGLARLQQAAGKADALAGTTYFGNGQTTRDWIINNWNNGALTHAQLLAYLKTVIDGLAANAWTQNAANAAANGATWVCYEGNDHVISDFYKQPQNRTMNAEQDAFVVAYKQTPLCADGVRYALDKFSALANHGTHVGFVDYSAVSGGSAFGFREYMGQTLTGTGSDVGHRWRVFQEWMDDQSNAPVAPAFATQPVSQTKNVGQSATFSVVVTGDPAPALQWRKGAANISGATGTSYTIASVASGDAGTYTCVATNPAGSATSAGATLTVTTATAPAFTTQPVAQTATAGATVTFTVAATGSPAPTLQWRENGVAISGATGTTYSN